MKRFASNAAIPPPAAERLVFTTARATSVDCAIVSKASTDPPLNAMNPIHRMSRPVDASGMECPVDFTWCCMILGNVYSAAIVSVQRCMLCAVPQVLPVNELCAAGSLQLLSKTTND